MDAQPAKMVVIGLITDGERYLISRRPRHVSFPGYWEFPGGKPELGESFETTLRRECQEELGCDVEVIRQVARVDPDPEHASITLFVYLCRLPEGQYASPLEVDELRWVEAHELHQYQFPPANDSLIEALRRSRPDDWKSDGRVLLI